MGLFDSLFGSKTTTTKNPFETNPWSGQQGYLTSGFQAAQDALHNALGQNQTAAMTPEQIQALQASQAMGMQGAAAGGSMMSAGQGQLGNFGTFGQNANDLYARSQVDPTQGIIHNAAQYADNPYLQSQIDSSIGDVSRGLQGALGGINSGAVAGGNMNSTRAGVSDGLAVQGAQRAAGDIASGMRSDAYSQGLGMAQGQYNQGMANQFNANGQILGAGQAGANLMTGGYGLGSGALKDAYGAGTEFQNQNQAVIDGQTIRPMSLIQQYMQSIGGNYGQQGYTSETSKSPSIFQQLLGGAASVMGGIGAMG